MARNRKPEQRSPLLQNPEQTENENQDQASESSLTESRGPATSTTQSVRDLTKANAKISTHAKFDKFKKGAR